jgi:hypothetical protein
MPVTRNAKRIESGRASRSLVATDHFQSTLGSWIGAELRAGEGGRRNVNRHVMETYAWPLTVYFRGTNMRWLGEEDEIINGFFESRLSQNEFFSNWQASGKRLRYWLINALGFYLKEVRHKLRRSITDDVREDDAVTFSGDQDAAIDRAAAIAFVQRAMQLAQESCERKNMAAHWQVFLRHHVDGVDLRTLGAEFSVTEARAYVMCKTAKRNFETALTEILLNDGVAAEEIDAEINRLLEAIGS